MSGGPLRLRALDREDFELIAACLQDSLIPVSDMQFLAAEQRFVLVANRFRWENCTETADQPETPPQPGSRTEIPGGTSEPCQTYERVNCGVTFEGVQRVRRRGIDPLGRGSILELLTFQFESGAVAMVFAGDAALRLEGPSISCRMEDIGEPWPTLWRPRHVAGETA